MTFELIHSYKMHAALWNVDAVDGWLEEPDNLLFSGLQVSHRIHDAGSYPASLVRLMLTFARGNVSMRVR